MIQIIDTNNSDKWDEIVKTFPNHDVYYLSGYVKAFKIHGDGEPCLLYYEVKMLRAIYVYIKRIVDNGWFDIITPYGYGGVIFDGDTSETLLNAFNMAFIASMNEQKIVNNFVRYHPLLQNANEMRKISNVIDLGNTISMDISSEEIIWANITSKNRNMIRKAEKNGVKIRHEQDMVLFEDFIRIYNSTMDKDKAEDYYYFGMAFYESIHNDLKGNYEMFYATYEGQIIAMSIILFCNGMMHYHLSGSMAEYRNLAPTNFLLYKAACWGCQQGFREFHLGGGVGSDEDNLFKFKAEFSRSSRNLFCIGKQIFNQQKYDELVEKRRNADASFNMESTFFPLYRANN